MSDKQIQLLSLLVAIASLVITYKLAMAAQTAEKKLMGEVDALQGRVKQSPGGQLAEFFGIV